MHTQCASDSAIGMAFLHQVEGMFPLVSGEFGFGAKADTACTGGFTASCGAFNDAVAFVFSQRRQECEKPAPNWRGEIQPRLVERLDCRFAYRDLPDDLNTVHHGARGPVPLGKDQCVAGIEGCNGFGKFGAIAGAATGRLFGEDAMAAGLRQRRDLPIKVLLLGRDAGVADEHAVRLRAPHEASQTYAPRMSMRLQRQDGWLVSSE